MSGPCTAVLFDVDGTLVDTPGGMASVLDTVVRETGREVDRERLRATVGRPLAASFATLLELPGEHEEVARAVERARRLFTETVIPSAADLVFPGVPEMLAELRGRGLPLAVVTSKIRRSAVELLEAAGLLDSFDTLSCHGMAPRGKPAPDLALLACGELGVPAGSCLVVGDAVDDMRMARGAGMEALGVGFGVATRPQLMDAGALSVSGSVGELHAALSAATAPTPLPLGSDQG
ncbi:HAD family hydrolase [Streptomyces mangrovi]|uniref:HAD family hydrolase n=1 Tax=Streptomyces mangrovi TaxID=1206892 RepID=UPI00399CDD1B